MSANAEVKTLAAVAAGGVAGATARWAVAAGLSPADTQSFPWQTFTVNVVGCFLIGVAAVRLPRPSLGWAFTATGVLGGFTTMSALALEANQFADADRRVAALAYIGLTLVAGFAALRVAESLAAPGHRVPVDANDPGGIE